VTDYEIRVKHDDKAICGLQLMTIAVSGTPSDIKSITGAAIGGTVTSGTGAQQINTGFTALPKVYLVPNERNT